MASPPVSRASFSRKRGRSKRPIEAILHARRGVEQESNGNGTLFPAETQYLLFDVLVKYPKRLGAKLRDRMILCVHHPDWNEHQRRIDFKIGTGGRRSRGRRLARG